MNTDNALERAYAHWYEDGFAEIGQGLFFIAIGALRATIHFVTAKSLYYYMLAGGLLIVFLSYGWVASRAVRALKTRISYPRTGYVAYKPRKPKRKRLVLILLFGGVLGGLIGILASQPDARLVEAFVPIAMSIYFAALFVYGARRLAVERFYLLAVLSVGAGVVAGSLGLHTALGLSIFFLCIGLVQIVSGGIALALYLRRNQPVALNEDSR